MRPTKKPRDSNKHIHKGCSKIQNNPDRNGVPDISCSPVPYDLYKMWNFKSRCKVSVNCCSIRVLDIFCVVCSTWDFMCLSACLRAHAKAVQPHCRSSSYWRIVTYEHFMNLPAWSFMKGLPWDQWSVCIGGSKGQMITMTCCCWFSVVLGNCMCILDACFVQEASRSIMQGYIYIYIIIYIRIYLHMFTYVL